MQFNPSIFTSVINYYLPEPHSSLLNGILFGIDLKTSKDLYEKLTTVGLLHLVVLSGMNITLLASIVAYLFSFTGKYITCLITILTIIIFVLFVGTKAPIVRSGLIGIFTFVSFILGKKRQPLFLLFLSGFLIFLIWPKWITTISFQLSFGATLGILLFARTKENKTGVFVKDFLQKLKNELKLSFYAQIFTAPLIFFHFRQLSVISPISNVFVSSMIAPLMVFGFLTAILGKINYHLGLIPAYICYGMLSYIILIIEFLSRLPYIFFQF